MPAPITLTTPIQYAKGVGDARAAEMVRLGIRTCGDLLFYLPREYLHFTDEAPVAAMRVGEVATIRGTILQTRMHRRGGGGAGGRGGSRLEALLQDEASAPDGTHDRCVLTWFNPYDLAKKVLPGALVRVTGKVTAFRGRFQIVQGKIEFLEGKDEEVLAKKQARLEPVYPATGELQSAVIWRLVKGVLEPLLPEVEEWFASDHLAERNLLSRREALRKMHLPGTLKEAITAKRSLAYHEFFLHQAAFAIRRYSQRHGSPAVPLRVDEAVDRRIRALLPFDMTAAQNRVIDAIRKDLAGTKPMNRLLQGDVGSGKTVVALYAMLAATATKQSAEVRGLRSETKGDTQSSVLSPPHFVGHQAALMAPTEILAEQHFITLSKLLEGKKVKIALLTGSVTGPERRETTAAIADGTIGLVVGTHALLSQDVRFKSLGMIVIDEQHKFGVEQRAQIRTRQASSGIVPHMLVMTATPIPRTLAMTAFGDLDVSVIDELPPGRLPIFTKMTQAANRDEVYAWLAKRLAKKEQAYVVVPLVDDASPAEEELELAPEPAVAPATSAEGQAGQPLSEAAPRVPATRFLRNAEGLQRELQSDLLKDFRIGMIHGRMNRETRQHIMERFRQQLIDVLVATTVIEVGVDVPNATTMIIEHADRFGLSQLHQLRGRIGRGTKQSTCVLLGDLTGDDGIARLNAMVRHTSGFEIAEQDLKLRGMGQLIGTAQSGRTDIHFPELLLDPVLLPLSRRDAFQLIAADPRLLDAAHAPLRKQILERFADTISLADVG